ncbi:group II intron maturase-specific domain-containing protein [Wolbachia endosymbiont (group A) of Sphecodes monilicornis]|uniref:group II intron maturase-specific domain-containing protein n=1 Tax=Wolbachia endosymbiont (group A) of Sphecodes monilicornis TaxID=2954060 RepID=UPI0022279A36|nr:group II intron maturase-specific domain-containing protein [Wolbachia endosymbiont (group A) of Sphecodes monilicornis]
MERAILIKPSRNSIKRYTLTAKYKLKEMCGAPQEAIIKNLNPLIRGWCQYYTSVISRKVFELLDSVMFRKLWKWAVRKHTNKGKYWIKRKYFKRYKNDNWRFMTSNGKYLIKHGDHAIKRHIKVRGAKSPYDGDWIYWSSRRVPDKSLRVIKLLKMQQGKCNYCQLYFRSEDIIEVHHQDKNRNNNTIGNLSLLHGHCHGAPRSAWRTVGENPTQTKSSQQFGTDHYVA